MTSDLRKYYKGPNVHDYSKAELALYKNAMARFDKRRELLITKLKRLKAVKGWTTKDLDDRGLYPHALLDPYFKWKNQAPLQASGGKGIGGVPLPDPALLGSIINATTSSGATSSAPPNIEMYGDESNIADLDEELALLIAKDMFSEEDFGKQEAIEKVSQFKAETKYGEEEEEEEKAYPDREMEEVARRLALFKANPQYMAKKPEKGGLVDILKKKEKRKPGAVYKVNIQSLLQTLYSQFTGAEIHLFNESNDSMPTQRRYSNAFLSLMGDGDYVQQLVELFNGLGVDLSSENRIDADTLYRQLIHGLQYNHPDGLNPTQRRANMTGKIREIFHNFILEYGRDKGKDALFEKGTGSNRVATSWSSLRKKIANSRATVRPYTPIKSPEQQTTDSSGEVKNQIEKIKIDLEDAGVPDVQVGRILDLLASSANEETWSIYGDSLNSWEEARVEAQKKTAESIIKILSVIAKDRKVDFSTQNIFNLIQYITKSLKWSVKAIKPSTFRRLPTIVSSDKPATIRQTLSPTQIAQQDEYEEDMKEGSPEEKRDAARWIAQNALGQGRISGTAVRAHILGVPVAVGTPRMKYSERVAFYEKKNREELLKLAKEQYTDVDWDSKSDIDIREMLADVPLTRVYKANADPDDPDDPESGMFIQVGNRGRIVKLSLLIALLVALGVSAKKIADYVENLKKGKDVSIDIPPAKPDDDGKPPPYEEPTEDPWQPTPPEDKPDEPAWNYDKRNLDLPSGVDIEAPYTSRDALEYTNIAKDFLKDPLTPSVGYDSFQAPAPDSILGAEPFNMAIIPDTPFYAELRSNVKKYNDKAVVYNQVIKDYEEGYVTGVPQGAWRSATGASVLPALDKEMATLRQTILSTAERQAQAISGNQYGKQPEMLSFNPLQYVEQQYGNGSLTKYNEMRQSPLSQQLGVNPLIDEYNKAAQEYNAEVDKMIKSNPNSDKVPPPSEGLLRAQVKLKDVIERGKKSISYEKNVQRIGRPESRTIEYSADDKTAIDKIGNDTGVPLTDAEERSLRDNPALYKDVKEYFDQVKEPQSVARNKKITELQNKFKAIQANNYEPSSVRPGVNYGVEYDENAEKLYTQSKTDYLTAVARLNQAASSGASKHQINQMYQDMDIKKTAYETNRVAFQTKANDWKRGQTAKTTNLSDMSMEFVPTNEKQRVAFDRLQNIESILQDNPEALSMYQNMVVKNIPTGISNEGNYLWRTRYLKSIAEQFNLSQAFNQASTENIDIKVTDIATDSDTVVKFDFGEDVGEGMERAEAIDPAEAKLFLSNKREAAAEQKRWEAFSNVQPFNGLGTVKSNPLLLRQVAEYVNQYANTTQGAYPTLSDMRNRDRKAVIRKQQLMPQISNAPFVPTVQCAFGRDVFENEFAIPTQQSGNNFMIDDNNLPDNKFSTWFKPNSYHPEYAIQQNNMDMSASGLNPGNNVRGSEWRFTDPEAMPSRYQRENLEYLGKTMNNNFGQNPNHTGGTIKYQNLNRAGAYNPPMVSIFDNVSTRQLGVKRR